MAQAERGARRGAPLERRVAAFARAERLFAPGDKVLVAVSGGPDSIALLRVLAALAPTWALTVHAIHVHHGLRGREADEDARFVAGVCDRLRIPLHLERISLEEAQGRARAGGSLQERAREARYQALRRAAAALDMGRVAVGHTADDQVETLLMWMLRGAGASGLAGIPDVREGVFIRPLLATSRAEILAYLDVQGQPFREDTSNAKPCYLRNRIRQDLVPVLKRFNPALLRVLARQAQILRDEDRCVEEQARRHLADLVEEDGSAGLRLDREGLLRLPVALQRRILRAILRRTAGLSRGPAFSAVETVLTRVVHGRSGAQLHVRGAVARREYQVIRFEGLPAGSHPDGPALADGGLPADGLVLPIPGEVRWPLTGELIRIRCGEPGMLTGRELPPGTRAAAVLDGDRFTWTVVVRPWKPGDRFHPQGMGGHRKKVQDYFTDIKLPRGERSRVPIIAAPEGILWVGGLRADHRFCASPSTRRPVIVELLGGSRQGRG